MKEIERKFLVSGDSYRRMAVSVAEIRQGYVSARPGGTVRVRIRDNSAWLTVKGPNHGATRDEWEYPVPVSDALEMLDRVTEGIVIVKRRYIVIFKGHTWEVDEFSGAHEGLVLAEVELESAGEAVALPPFVGEEVTGDARYYNSTLSTLI